MKGIEIYNKSITFLRTPFPRPTRNLKNSLWLLLVGVICSVFIIVFRPFNIENQTGDWYIDVILFSLGIVFSLSIYFIEFLLPSLLPKLFKHWNLGKAILWYTLAILFVGAIMFLYKSFLGGFHNFTLMEYVFVVGRVLGISLTVSFSVLGVFTYFNRKQMAMLSVNENYLITSTNSKPINLNLNDILYIVSDDNYVDIHLELNGERKKEIFRSSLKNLEAQIVNPVTPIYRCHRKYLINIKRFKVHKMNSRTMVILLEKYDDEIPVSKQHANQINKLLQIHP